MSSILDALKKVEEEQEQLKAQETLRPEDIDPADAANDLIGQDVLRDKMTLQVSPLVLMAGGLITLVILVGVITFVVASVMKPEPINTANSIASTPPTSIAPVVPELQEEPLVAPSEPIAETTLPEEATEVVESTPLTPDVVPPEEPVESAPIEETPVPTPVVTDPPIKVSKAPKPAPKMIEKEAEPLPKPETTVLQKEGPLDFTPSPSKSSTPAIPDEAILAQNDKPINMYPRFTAAVRMKYGLNDFKINMVSPQSARNPYGSAIINREKVFEGNYIADSQVLLFKVEKNGVAFEIPRTGKRYYSRF